MRNKDLLSIVLIVFLYLSVLLLTHKEIFNYHFDQKLIKRYFLSQDIPHEVAGKRLFLSDEDIYIASGFLYVKGEDPSGYNFDHPPLLKYLFGYAIILFANPYHVQILLGAELLLLVYYTGLKIYKSTSVSILSCLFLIVDPLFIDSSTHVMLDLGEVVFLLLGGLAQRPHPVPHPLPLVEPVLVVPELLAQAAAHLVDLADLGLPEARPREHAADGGRPAVVLREVGEPVGVGAGFGHGGLLGVGVFPGKKTAGGLRRLPWIG